MNVHGGMTLAAQQPQAAALNRPAPDPKRHRLGLLKMKIGSTHPHRGAKGEFVSYLTARGISQFPDAKYKIVCLNRGCLHRDFAKERAELEEKRGGVFESDAAAMAALHPPKREMLAAGDIHVWGYFSPDPKAKDDVAAADFERNVARAEQFVVKARKACDDAKDPEAHAEALGKLDHAEKYVEELKKLRGASEIVGFASDEHFDVEE